MQENQKVIDREINKMWGVDTEQIVGSYIESEKLQNQPCDLNPKIKIDIIKLCIETKINLVSKKLKIPIQILEAWHKEYEELGETELLMQHKANINQLKESQKLEILTEVAIEGIDKVSAKYGIMNIILKDWGRKIRSLGKGYSKREIATAKANKYFTKEEKIKILEEAELNGKLETARKYELNWKTLDIWAGKLNIFGVAGLQSTNGEGTPKYLNMTQQLKYKAVQYFKTHGMEATTQKFGTSSGCLYKWNRLIDNLGEEQFMRGYRGFGKKRASTKKKEEYGGKDILASCGLFQGMQTLSNCDEIHDNSNIDNYLLKPINIGNDSKYRHIYPDPTDIHNTTYDKITTFSHVVEKQEPISSNISSDDLLPQVNNINMESNEHINTECPPNKTPVNINSLAIDYDHHTNILKPRDAPEQEDFEYMRKVKLLLKEVKKILPLPIFTSFKYQFGKLLDYHLALANNT